MLAAKCIADQGSAAECMWSASPRLAQAASSKALDTRRHPPPLWKGRWCLSRKCSPDGFPPGPPAWKAPHSFMCRRFAKAINRRKAQGSAMPQAFSGETQSGRWRSYLSTTSGAGEITHKSTDVFSQILSLERSLCGSVERPRRIEKQRSGEAATSGGGEAMWENISDAR